MNLDWLNALTCCLNADVGIFAEAVRRAFCEAFVLLEEAWLGMGSSAGEVGALRGECEISVLERRGRQRTWRREVEAAGEMPCVNMGVNMGVIMGVNMGVSIGVKRDKR